MTSENSGGTGCRRRLIPNAGRPPEISGSLPVWAKAFSGSGLPRTAPAKQALRGLRRHPPSRGGPGGRRKGGNQVPDQETAPVARSFRSPLKNSRQIRQLISGMVAWGRSRTQLYRSMGRPCLS